MAISTCLSHLSNLPPNGKYLLLTDSLSSLHSLTDPYNSNPLIQRIYLTLHSLISINTNITFIWIPGHIDLPEHDAVDLAAKQALSFPLITDHSQIPASDYKIHFRSLILQQWYNQWDNQTTNKLRRIKQIPLPWISSNRSSKREEVVLTRLRIGHTRITHAHLINPLLSPARCPHCFTNDLSVDHLFTCPLLQSLRSSFQVPSSPTKALKNNSATVSLSLQYLRQSSFYTSI